MIETTHESGRISISVVIVSLLIVVVCGAIWYFFFSPSESVLSEQAYTEYMTQESNMADSLRASNEIDAAIATYDRMLAASRNDTTSQLIAIQKASTLFSTGELEDAYAAIAILGELLDSEKSTNVSKGWAISELLSFYYYSQHSEIFSRIQALHFFADLKDLPMSEFLQKAAEKGNALYPTMLGKLFLAAPLAQSIVATGDPLTAKVLAAQVVRLVKESESIQAQEPMASSTPYYEMLGSHYRALLLYAAAKGGVEDPPLVVTQFEAAAYFENALQIAKNNPANQPAHGLSLFTHFYYAAYALEFGYADVANEQLAQLTERLTGSENLTTFGLFVQAALRNQESSSYRMFVALTKHSPSFRDALQTTFGLTFDETAEVN